MSERRPPPPRPPPQRPPPKPPPRIPPPPKPPCIPPRLNAPRLAKAALAPPILIPPMAELPGRLMFGRPPGRIAGLAAGRALPPGRPAGRLAACPPPGRPTPPTPPARRVGQHRQRLPAPRGGRRCHPLLPRQAGLAHRFRLPPRCRPARQSRRGGLDHRSRPVLRA